MAKFILQVRSFGDAFDQGESIGKIIGIVLVSLIALAAIGYFISKNRAKYRICDNCGKREQKENILAIRLKRSGKIVEFCSTECKSAYFDKRRPSPPAKT